MCYYNGIKVTRAEYIRLKELEKLVAHYDFLVKPLEVGFNYSPYPVLKKIEDQNDFDIVPMEWGFIPFYIPNRRELAHFRSGGINPDTGKYDQPILTLNAIGEELFMKPTYKQSALSRRCLVLSSGFFEWRHIFPKNKKTGQPLKTAIKYPYYIHLPEKEYFYMAGIWTPWTDKETGEYVESFAIVTAKANFIMEQVHNSKKRMPTILNEELGYEWMFGKLDQKRITEIATTQYPAQEMHAYSIAKEFRSALDPMEPVEYAELPPLIAA
jgi:putative SOS response-associated peptidase YedK